MNADCCPCVCRPGGNQYVELGYNVAAVLEGDQAPLPNLDRSLGRRTGSAAGSGSGSGSGGAQQHTSSGGLACLCIESWSGGTCRLSASRAVGPAAVATAAVGAVVCVLDVMPCCSVCFHCYSVARASLAWKLVCCCRRVSECTCQQRADHVIHQRGHGRRRVHPGALGIGAWRGMACSAVAWPAVAWHCDGTHSQEAWLQCFERCNSLHH